MTVIGTLFAVLLAVTACHAAEGWNYATLDGGDDWSGSYSSLEFDRDGYAHVTYVEYVDYYPVGHTELIYIRWTGSEWVEELRYFGQYGVGKWSDLELDENDLPHVAYTTMTDDLENWHLGYSYFDGSQWHHEIVDDGPRKGLQASLEIDSQGHPHIAHGQYYGGLWYAYHDGSNWSIEHLDAHPNMYVPYSSLELDQFDHPHISYSRQSSRTGHLLYVHWNGSDWVYEEVGSVGHTASTSLELDSFDRPHIAVGNREEQDTENVLRYFYYNGSDWEYETVDDYGATGFQISLALDSQDNPSISYHNADYPHQDLRYARRTPDGWETLVVDDFSEDMGRHTCLKMDSDDDPHITYLDKEHVDLRYACYGDPMDLDSAEFVALPGDDGVELSWLVEDASDVDGYNIYSRPFFAGGETAWLKLNPSLLPGGTSGRWLDRDVEAGGRYEYRLEALRVAGAVEIGRTEAEVPSGYGSGPLLYAAYPCPSRGSAVIEFDLPQGGEAVLEVYDLSGRLVSCPVDGPLSAGLHRCTVEGLSSGVYLYRLRAGGEELTRRLVVTR